LHDQTQDAPVKSFVKVMELADGDMAVQCSEGMEKNEIIGNLLLAAINMAGR
jgi:hypothetical protein